MCRGQEAWQYGFVPLERIIMDNLRCLFGGMAIESAHTFRVTRNAELDRQEDEAEDLLDMIADEARSLLTRSCCDHGVHMHARRLQIRQLLRLSIDLTLPDLPCHEHLSDRREVLLHCKMRQRSHLIRQCTGCLCAF